MKDLINYIAQKSNLPPVTAEAVASVMLEHLKPRCSPLLKNTIEVTLDHPNLSDAQKDLLIATRVLFPEQTEAEPPDTIEDPPAN